LTRNDRVSVLMGSVEEAAIFARVEEEKQETEMIQSYEYVNYFVDIVRVNPECTELFGNTLL